MKSLKKISIYSVLSYSVVLVCLIGLVVNNSAGYFEGLLMGIGMMGVINDLDRRWRNIRLKT